MRLKIIALFGLFAAYGLFVVPVSAETHTVQVKDFVYDPPALTINEGDTVIWVGIDDYHDVTSGTNPMPDGIFSSDILNHGNAFSYTFYREVLNSFQPANDTFPYFCRPHADMGMQGTIAIQRIAKTLSSVLTRWQYDPTNTQGESTSCTFTINAAETSLSVSCDTTYGTFSSLTLNRGSLGSTGSLLCNLGGANSGSCAISHELADALLGGETYLLGQLNSGAILRGQIYKAGGSQEVRGRVLSKGIIPVAGVAISDGTQGTLTQSDGTFVLTGVINGVYRISASLEGYSLSPEVGVTPYLVNSGNVNNRNFAATSLVKKTIVIGDIDGDLKADPILFNKGKIFYQSSLDGRAKLLFPVKALTVIAGAFNSDEGTSLAAVTKSGSSLAWNLFDSQGSLLRTFNLGSSKGELVPGCDSNGDGVTDIGVRVGKNLTFSTDIGATTQSTKITSATKSYCSDNLADKNIDIDADGDGVSEVGKITYVSGKSILQLAKKKYVLCNAKIDQIFRYRELNNDNGIFYKDSNGAVWKMSFPGGKKTKTRLSKSKTSILVRY